MSRKSAEERINALDLQTCQYMLLLIYKSIPFALALQSAEKTMKKKFATETSGQPVIT